MSLEMARDFDSSDVHLSATYMWVLEESLLYLYFNRQIEQPGSGNIRSVTRLERKSALEADTQMESTVAERRDGASGNISWPLVKQWGQKCSKHSNCAPLGAMNQTSNGFRRHELGCVRDFEPPLGPNNFGYAHDKQCVAAPAHDTGELPVLYIQRRNYVTRALGFKYLWIDSLCIIQDSVEDWATESASMHSIYGNSSYNISAIASSSSSEGLFLKKPVYTPIRINIFLNGAKTPHIMRMHDTWNEFITSSPLNLRGWVCQERLLSPRVLHFSKHQIFWECGQLSASEDWPEGVPPRPVPEIDPFYPKYILPHDDHGIKRHGIKRQLSEIVRGSVAVDRKNIQIVWAKVVKLYTRASLTYSTDRLVAISGIAAQFQPKIRSKYLAGLWECNIATDLLWRVENTDDLETVYPKRELQARPVEFIAPTWSWASINTAVDLESLPKPKNPDEVIPDSRIIVDVLEVDLQRASSDIYGQITGGYVRVQGRLATARQTRGEVGLVGNDLNLEVSNEVRSSDAWPCTVGIEWDTIESIREKKEFGKHLYYLLAVRISQRPNTEDSHALCHVEGLVLRTTSSPSTFQRHGVFEWHKHQWIREEDNRIHALNEGFKLFDETMEAHAMERTIDLDGHCRYTFDIV
ncbi:hypothetical protein IFR05_012928 [Cadophora sp. M221]|nr:hypothetical protein IFR05_012928 [Cadophora sp. M221]